MRSRRWLLAAAALAVLPLLAEFRQALPGYAFEFPRDHFAHPEFQIEWWYYTGNVYAADGRRFGFELTFFRNAVERDEPTQSPWDVDQIYLAHFALSDLDSGRFYKAERLNRAGPGLAGADLGRGLIWNGNWQAEWLDTADPLGRQRLRAIDRDFAVELEATPAKPPVVNGRDGVSQKAEGAGRASHYVTFTRLTTRGTVRVGDETLEVEGTAWMDHEFSTDSMGPDQRGWDWMSLQLDDGREVMLYRMRKADGSTDPYSAGTYVEADGESLHLSADDFTMTPQAYWTSPDTGGRYPLVWRAEVPRLGLDFRVTTPLDGQEIVPRRGRGPAYWEGAVDYEGDGVSGVGYLEMTGYDRTLQLGIPGQARSAPR